MGTYQDTLKSVENQLAQVISSPVVGICFLDEQGRLVQILDQDPALREIIVEFHMNRLDQLIRSAQAWHVCETLITDQPAAVE